MKTRRGTQFDVYYFNQEVGSQSPKYKFCLHVIIDSQSVGANSVAAQWAQQVPKAALHATIDAGAVAPSVAPQV